MLACARVVGPIFAATRTEYLHDQNVCSRPRRSMRRAPERGRKGLSACCNGIFVAQEHMATEKLSIHAVILAGGRGTRFWPRSRTRTPKQLLNIVGKETMLEQTLPRLLPVIPPERIWTVTNSEQAQEVRRQVPAPARRRVLTESVGRNTAAAIALAALHIRHSARGDALMAVLPADHYIANPERYRVIVRAALEMAREPGRMVVLGIPPTRPDTGFGY